jgi:4a-hydroxytetrahydrobiopterin dehydratase
MKKGRDFYRGPTRTGKAHLASRNPAQIPFVLRKADATSPHPQPNPTIPMADLLNAQDIKSWLKKLPEWDHEKKHIERTFEFDDFSQAIEFVNGVAEIAEEDDHHPDIDIRDSKVRLSLSTHSEGGVTDLDFEVAEKIDTLVE